MTEKMFLNVSEAAELLGVNKITMYKYIRNKVIPAVKIGNKTWKIPRKSLDMMVEESLKKDFLAGLKELID